MGGLGIMEGVGGGAWSGNGKGLKSSHDKMLFLFFLYKSGL